MTSSKSRNSKSRTSKSRSNSKKSPSISQYYTPLTSPLKKSLNKYLSKSIDSAIDSAIAKKANEIMQKKINDKYLTPNQIKKMEQDRHKQDENEKIANQKYNVQVNKALGSQKPSRFKRFLKTFRRGGGKGKQNNKSKTRKNK